MAQKDTTNYIVGGVVVIIIILLGGLLITRKHAPSQSLGAKATSTTTMASDTIHMGGSDTLTIADQKAGKSVKIMAMEIGKSSWVAIKEVSSGHILGAAWFPAGATSGEVSLLRTTVKDGKYEGIVYEDNGDKQFDMHKDSPVEGASAAFSAQ
jgi:hypothetical protein